MERVASLPGVEAVALASQMPFGGVIGSRPITVPGRPAPSDPWEQLRGRNTNRQSRLRRRRPAPVAGRPLLSPITMQPAPRASRSSANRSTGSGASPARSCSPNSLLDTTPHVYARSLCSSDGATRPFGSGHRGSGCGSGRGPGDVARRVPLSQPLFFETPDPCRHELGTSSTWHSPGPSPGPSKSGLGPYFTG